MTSWRHEASREVQDDLDGLAGAAIALAERVLSHQEGFHPFAFQLDKNGLQRLLGALDDRVLGGQADELSLLTDELRAEASSTRACVLAVDTRVVSTGQDAIRLHLEHCSGICLRLTIPYTRRPLSSPLLGEPMLAPAQREVWSQPEGADTEQGHRG